jgi:hypothetical protein
MNSTGSKSSVCLALLLCPNPIAHGITNASITVTMLASILFTCSIAPTLILAHNDRGYGQLRACE